MSVKITIIGTGYVGLVSGACFAELGHDVICVDADQRKIDMIAEGRMPIYEPALDQLVARNVELGRLRFSNSTKDSVKGRDAVFIAVGTPSDGAGRADLRFVFAAAMEVANAIDQFTVIVTKSTVPVGTNHQVYSRVLERLGHPDAFAVASNPEFLREGAAIQDFMEPDRVVIGCENDRAKAVMERIYAPLTVKGSRLVATNIETAEMIKYAANAFLAIKVSFINEVADLCEVINANVNDVALGIGLDHRIGAAFLKTGPGWGGSCFPKDTRALLMTARDAGMPATIVQSAIEANVSRKKSMVERVRRMCGGSVAGKKIAVLGVTFKGQTDDMRESPSLDILPPLVLEGAVVEAYDPSNPHDAAALLPEVTMAESAIAAATDADLIVVLTEWMIFTTIDLAELASVMRTPALLDLRNLFDRGKAEAAGFTRYVSLGQTGESIGDLAIAEPSAAINQ
ncbi:UDP-glucose dehydrogenase family protein [Hansschlegelia sp. KR7-227]|jgi:UDPglucose 6-dehydrogenase|uniref:UDP-glucose dehydrogenase family protein n=1 Tax=Hansschlegelia sp. KR7-227 TaxID=3400914 RepID=UPI003C1265B3